MKFYRLLADPVATQKWHLQEPVDKDGNSVDARLFTEGMVVSTPGHLEVPLRRSGGRLDFNFGDFDMIVTPAALNAELELIVGSAIQRIPVAVESANEQYEILNVLDTVNCIDETRSAFTKWTAEDGRPDKVGEYRMITRLRLRSDAVRGHHLFRVAEWPIALIASEQVKTFLESRGTTGVAYHAVT